MKSFKFIKDRFLKLTSKTYPYGTEDDLVIDMKKRGVFPNLDKDPFGNYFYKIGESRTVFASHLDTACKDQNDVTHVVSKQQVVTTNGKTILGADDKAGITILLWLIENKVPGLYYFFIGEEVGCIGSGELSKAKLLEGGYDRMISFDRRGTNSVITHQRSYRCCSDEFADELANQLNKTNNFFYKKDDTGVYTDSAEFVNQIPECTNISVGYMKEHTFMESQDLFHLGKLAISVLDVDWENLPSKRKAEDKEYLWTEYPQWNQHGYSKKKRNRRSHSKGRYEHPRVFYDNFGQLEEIKTKNNRGIYDPLRDRFLTSDLSKRELDIIKYQSMDIENISDRKIYDSLYELLE